MLAVDLKNVRTVIDRSCARRDVKREYEESLVKNCPFLEQVLYPYGRIAVAWNEPRSDKFFRSSPPLLFFS